MTDLIRSVAGFFTNKRCSSMRSVLLASAVFCLALLPADRSAAQIVLPDVGGPELDMDRIPALAEGEESPFILQVPVRLQRLHPDVTRGRVVCWVYIDTRTNGVAAGMTNFPIDPATGSYAGTVEVWTSRDPEGGPLEEANRYACQLSLGTATDDPLIPYQNAPEMWLRAVGDSRSNTEGQFQPATDPP
jgi:hypothetical protein